MPHIPPHIIRGLIISEFQFNAIPDDGAFAIQQQSLLIEAFQARDFRAMALVLEEVGDFFSRTGENVQSAARMYQTAIQCLCEGTSSVWRIWSATWTLIAKYTTA